MESNNNPLVLIVFIFIIIGAFISVLSCDYYDYLKNTIHEKFALASFKTFRNEFSLCSEKLGTLLIKSNNSKFFYMMKKPPQKINPDDLEALKYTCNIRYDNINFYGMNMLLLPWAYIRFRLWLWSQYSNYIK